MKYDIIDERTNELINTLTNSVLFHANRSHAEIMDHLRQLYIELGYDNDSADSLAESAMSRAYLRKSSSRP